MTPLSAATKGCGLQRTPYAGVFKSGTAAASSTTIVYPAKHLGVLLMSNSDNAEGILAICSS